MESLGNPRGTIDDEISAFNADRETSLAESTIQQLISTYPANHTIEHVLVKVITITTLYHARVLDIDLQPLSCYIASLALDAKLKEGDPEAVTLIWNSTGTKRRYFSFATKFCSWHNQGAYAIYDMNVWTALAAYRAKNERFTFRNTQCDDYPGFLAVVKSFQKVYGLEDYSLKDIDKFLWGVGYRIIAGRQKATTTSRPKE
jgi:hypothetical protein